MRILFNYKQKYFDLNLSKTTTFKHYKSYY